MKDKIKSIYDDMTIIASFRDEKEFKIGIFFEDISAKMPITVNCSKYAKFLINDFNALRNKDPDIHSKIEGVKLCALFGISEQYLWFSRKELIQFIEKECESSTDGVVG